MPIQEQNIKLVKSSVMLDVPEGGGPPSANVILDAQSNAIFDDISELARAGGNVSMRKVHAVVHTDDTSPFLGVNVIIAEPPKDPRVSVTIFPSRDTFDTRLAAAATVESYLISSSMWPGFLFENHVAGQRIIQLFQRPSVANPTIGRTLVLVFDEGKTTERSQYVRIIRVDSIERTFTRTNGEAYQAKVVSCDISDALRYAFPGSPDNEFFTVAKDKTLTRDTSVADAGSYCGVVPLKLEAKVGDSKAVVTTVYTSLVPSAATEKVEVDVLPSATRNQTLATTPRLIEVGLSPHSMRVRIGQENRSFSYVQILNPLPAPGSIEVSFMALGEWYSLLDDGLGSFTGQGTGTVNYLTGSISITLPSYPDSSTSLIYAWGETRGYTNMSGLATFRQPEFSLELDNEGIDPGSLVVTWLSGGVLKTATADLKGYLSGHATGFVSHTLGRLNIIPSAMPDAGGEFSITYTWNTVKYETKELLSISTGGFVTFQTDEVPVEGSVSVEWITIRQVSSTSGGKMSSGSGMKSSSSNSATNGTILNDYKPMSYSYTSGGSYSSGGGAAPAGSGYAGGVGRTYSPSTTVTVDYAISTARVSSTTVTSSSTGGSSSKHTTASSQVSNQVIAVSHNLTEDGEGGFMNSMGTINYQGKTITVKVVDPSTTTNSYSSDTESGGDFGAAASSSSSDPGQSAGWGVNLIPASSSSVSSSSGGSSSSQGGSYGTTGVKETFDNTALQVIYRTGAAVSTPHTQSYVPPVVTIDLAPYTTSRIAPHSVRFTWMGHVYQDLDGKLYRDPGTTTTGVLSGIIDYITGMAHLTDYVVSGSPTALSLDSLWVSKGDWTTSRAFFRTASAPIKPGGLVLSAIDVAGTQIIGTSDIHGLITGDHCLGTIDYQTGTVDLIFGDLVDNSSLTDDDKAEWWYAKAATQITAAGKVWRPWPIDPNSIRYNAVSYFYLPLNADILGIDPVRLTQDGKVPIFMPGGFAVVGNTKRITAQSYSNNQTILCGRERLSRVRLVDSNGAVITTGYTPNLDAGSIFMEDTATWAHPVVVEHRIEDMVQLSDVQITGQLGFTRPLSHDYPAESSYVSSALVAGDMRARVSVVFDQYTWTGVWSDTLIGSACIANYNSTVYPIVVTNAGAITEKWIIKFSGSTGFVAIGQNIGQLSTTGAFNTPTVEHPQGVPFAPLNPITGVPYFSIPVLGWGAGWVDGNVLRFNTIGLQYPFWVVRTVQQGPETISQDSFSLLVRGDVDAPYIP